MRNLDIDTTFSAIRQAPLEVEYHLIEKYVLQLPLQSVDSKTNLKNWLNNTNITILLIVAVATISAIFFSYKASMQKLPVADAIELEVHELSTITPQSEIFENNLHPHSSKKNTPPLLSEKDSCEPKKEVIFTDVRKTASLMHPTANKLNIRVEAPDDNTMDYTLVSSLNAQNNAPLRVRTFTSNYCTFDGEDVWIKAFIKALINDNIIRDTVDLRFTFSLSSFKVNSKELSESEVTKYNQLYTGITNVELSSKSKISLSVGGSSCTLTKTIEE